MHGSAVGQTRTASGLITGPDGAARVAAFVDLLLTVGYIDGRFHQREQAFVRQYVDSVMVAVEQALAQPGPERQRIRDAWAVHFADLYARLHAEVAALAGEVVAAADGSYLATRLKVRALTLFRGLAPEERPLALELIHALVRADGIVTLPERDLYDELCAYFATTPPVTPHAAGAAAASAPLRVAPPTWLPLRGLGHPLLDPLEQTYSPHPVELQAQLARDYRLIDQAMQQWARQRAFGGGRLAGIDDPGTIPVGARFLDGFVHVLRPDRPVELVVLGDLHGCYGCLKAALLQSDFINRVWMHQWDPANHPDVKLVLLGDYIDRGRFSFDGVLRAVLQLFVAMPDHVVVLRGNHEYFVWLEDTIYSGVHPAEALTSIRPHVPPEMLEAYRTLFELMPTTFLFDRTLFVHGGVPREDTFASRYRDLSSLNDPELRFQMLWSDPADTEHVPVELQRHTSRFTFGRRQFRAFMERVGCHTMIRGHEKIDRGFDTVYDLGDRLLLNLFSAGGHDNTDLPEGASYRSVTPMALTIQHGRGPLTATPWPIDYQPFNYETHNGLHRRAPVLEFRYA